MMLISFCFAVSQFVTCNRFSQITSHIVRPITYCSIRDFWHFWENWYIAIYYRDLQNNQITELNSSSVTRYKTPILVYLHCFPNLTYHKLFYTKYTHDFLWRKHRITKSSIWRAIYEHRDYRSYHIEVDLILYYTIPYKNCYT